eukprot:6166325-Prymnesium_polylepis.1
MGWRGAGGAEKTICTRGGSLWRARVRGAARGRIFTFQRAQQWGAQGPGTGCECERHTRTHGSPLTHTHTLNEIRPACIGPTCKPSFEPFTSTNTLRREHATVRRQKTEPGTGDSAAAA